MNIVTLTGVNKIDSLVTVGSSRLHSFYSKVRQYLIALVVISLAAVLCYELSQRLGYHVVSYILLILVSILATFLKTGPVLMASLLSLLLWNFFFIPPHNTFHIEKSEDIFMFCMFGIVVILNGIYTTRVRRQEKWTREREARTNALFQLTRELSKTSGIDKVISVSQKEIKKHLTFDAFIVPCVESSDLPEFDQVKHNVSVSFDEYSIAAWAFRTRKKAGKFTEEFTNSEYAYYPLPGTLINPGVVIFKPEKQFTEDMEMFRDTFLSQIANALEREFLAELARKASVLDESDRFYKTLFNSVSHELRIPVATVLAATDALIGSSNNEGLQYALSKEIYTATLRLNRLIENLLNMSRLESGRIALRLDWYDLNDLVNKVINDLQEELKAFTLNVSVPDSIPLVKIDFGLMEQVLYNLVYNACQYAPVTTEISVLAEYIEGNLIIKVLDKGPGFSQESIGNVFDKFFRANTKSTGGLGLGLSIVKGFTEAHKGYVVAENGHGEGAVITVTIPSEVPDMTDISMEKSDG